jgi:hypothetical protein
MGRIEAVERGKVLRQALFDDLVMDAATVIVVCATATWALSDWWMVAKVSAVVLAVKAWDKRQALVTVLRVGNPSSQLGRWRRMKFLRLARSNRAVARMAAAIMKQGRPLIGIDLHRAIELDSAARVRCNGASRHGVEEIR